jgi:signal transduction histidine kinase
VAAVRDAQRQAAAEESDGTERLALARDLHDVAAHHLTGLIVSTQVAQLGSRADPQVRRTLTDIEAAGKGALASLRQVVRLLRDDAPAVAPAAESLVELVDRFGRTGIRAELDLPDGPLPLDWPTKATTGIYRIVQEALTNVATARPGCPLGHRAAGPRRADRPAPHHRRRAARPVRGTRRPRARRHA